MSNTSASHSETNALSGASDAATMNSETGSRDALRRSLEAERSNFGRDLLSDQVYDLVRRLVMEQALKPGDRVVELELSQRLGISQAPVRDAVKRLAYEGVLTHVPRRGHFVTVAKEDDLEHAIVARTMIERTSARLAAEAMSDDAKAVLESVVERMREAAAIEDVAAFRVLDFQFHREVCTAGGNPLVVKCWDVIEPAMRSSRAVGDPLFKGDWAKIADEHAKLLKLLRPDKADAAADAFARHASLQSP
ncbi:GntR family transcriptional regulator [Planctomonas sp. JC2975]|uniref:FCD domain-containing protein n=1 Tax=Planctomonas sp. JC2975 TaxID=2729626 RepID=UPI00147363E1|nr:GntR family transcriptional regulator [Planctomonas sp. JC2975]